VTLIITHYKTYWS